MLDETILTTALAAASSAGAVYAEARGVDGRQAVVAARDGAVDNLNEQRDTGWGIRVAVQGERGGGWGFASTAQWDADSAAATAQLAVEIARASASISPAPLLLDDLPTAQGEYATTLQRDPFDVPVAEQIDLVREATARMRAANPRIVAASVIEHASRTEKRFINSLGANLRQTIIEVEGNLQAYAQDDSGYTYRRSLDNMHQAGWEFIEGMRLREEAERVAHEAAALVV